MTHLNSSAPSRLRVNNCNESQRGIELLQERRTALISAAVTGKIDVRRTIEKEAS